MKRFLAIILCAFLMCIMPIVASAEEIPSEEETPTVEETTTETTAPVEETVPEKTITESIVEWVQANLAELSVVATVLLSIFYEKLKHGKLNGSIGALNNNAITIANNSAESIKTALAEVEDIAKVVKDYKEEISTFLSEIRKSAEEKECLESTLAHVETFLKSAKLATLELSNEVAELLVLANIPVSKKDELYARHTKAVHELEAVEEVMNGERKEA